MKKNLKKSLMVLTVLATPITVNAVSDNNEAQATQVKETAKKQVATAAAKQTTTTKNAETTAKQTTTKQNTTTAKQAATKQNTTTTKQATTTSKAAAKKVGWTQVGNTWYYYNAQGNQVKNTWVGSYWLGSDGKMVTSGWVDGGKYYVGKQGWWVKDAKKTAETTKSTTTTAKKSGWSKVGNTWYYYDAKGSQVKNAWIGSYWLGSDGKMATNSWVDGGKYFVGNQGWWVKDAKKTSESAKTTKSTTTTAKKSGWVQTGNVWYHYDSKGALTKNAWVGSYWLGSDGKMVTNGWVDGGKYFVGKQGWWVKDAKKGGKAQDVEATSNEYSGHYKVTGLYIPVYDSNGKILSHISQGTIIFKDNRASASGRIPVQVAGLVGYVNPSQVQAVNSSTTFIPDYVSDGKYVYHRYSKNSSVRVAHHHSSMQVGKSYYSADGINFGSFKLDHPFQFSNLKTKTNYTASDINKLYTLMGASNSMLAGKGATFKAAEQKYGVNALYLVAHSALESAWGKSNIAKAKNNFFGIAAYDSSPYTSATKFDNVDAGILGAARWINEKYLSNSSYPARGAHLGNKVSGMNVNYATAPHWGESIASIMFDANEKLGRKDK
ncbi:glucosaminidase domain-containing protein [Gemella sanguinis]|jgi:putative mannosyl-glycoprotein endo-beta-N-acetylglucosaminidase|uniref:Endo-beta-N-acetylglucosaminidase n=1 Tax=Gemella sanguinis TaxID=84135 RepID=A0A2N6SES3_9BACL|nr:glucosaminidase domain-containing protein [Gemella sanguinis]PMC52445.1 endo-beta-N-acetylglucosaminidase [Gemella sanguinis]